MITIKADTTGAVGYLIRVEKSLKSGLESGLREASTKLTNFVKANYLSAPYTFGRSHPTKLAIASGKLYRSTHPLPVVNIGENMLNAGAIIGDSGNVSSYVRTHVSVYPTEKEIVPIKKRRLAIPLPPALATGGIRRVFPIDLPKGSFRGKKDGNSVLGTSIIGSSFIPYFIMSKRVKIKSKVHTSTIVSLFKDDVEMIISKNINSAVK